jgi:hypothetical protein
MDLPLQFVLLLMPGVPCRWLAWRMHLPAISLVTGQKQNGAT